MIGMDLQTNDSTQGLSVKDKAFMSLDPLFTSYAMLFIKDVLELKKMTDRPMELFKLYSHYIQLVEVNGEVTGIDRLNNAVIYTVDDGTGSIPCIHYWDDGMEPDFEMIAPKTAVSVVGTLTEIEGKRKIKASAVTLSSPSQEHTNQQLTIQLKEHYAKPLTLSEAIVRNEEAILEAFLNNCSTEDIPTLDSLLLRENLPTMKTLQEAVLKKYRTLKISRLDRVLTDPHLIQLATTVANGMEGKTQAKQLIKEAHRLLIRQGDIMEVKNQSDFYQPVDDEYLRSLVLKIVNETTMQLALANNYRGITSPFIVARVEQTPEFEDFAFCEVKVNNILGKMVDCGDLYLTSNNHYKPTVPEF
ncbi:hypothetical protein BDF20DRAFT_872983 [Mycotypha africana]|uniref:uncharacterized protein n=1 Tax=Mycotypha africana TaxID=64632 RepID=UPI002301F36C|nr:uncharacterized protein BDF20DRAFT_872983 [Mycotypha africana]KAI8977111.1 hypothetical protein BDF20DRAFT_872983 [Mycotypha africana]